MGIKDGVGYRYVWFFLILCTAIGTSLLSPRIFRELYPSRESEPLMVSEYDTHPVNTPYPVNRSFQYTSMQHTLSIHRINTPCQYILSIHPINATPPL